MSIFRPAVKYGFVIAVVIGISLSYVNRYEWFPQIFKQAKKDTGEKSVAVESPVQETISSSSGTQVSKMDEGQVGPTPSPTEMVPLPGAAKQLTTEPKQVTTEQKAVPEQPLAPTMPQATSTAQETASGQPASPEKSVDRVEMTSAPEGQAITQQDLSASQPLQTIDQYINVLMDARMAYWQGNFEAATDEYQQAIKIMPDNPDAYGELGNLYYSQGQWEKAGDAYYQAAVHLLDAGDMDRAAQLGNVIQGLTPERAEELQKRIQSVLEQGQGK